MVHKKVLPNLNPTYILFNDLLKKNATESGSRYLGTTYSKGFKDLLQDFPEIVSYGILVYQYSNWYIHRKYLFNPECRYVFKNFLFQYYQLNRNREEMRRAKKKIKNAIIKMNLINI